MSSRDEDTNGNGADSGQTHQGEEELPFNKYRSFAEDHDGTKDGASWKDTSAAKSATGVKKVDDINQSTTGSDSGEESKDDDHENHTSRIHNNASPSDSSPDLVRRRRGRPGRAISESPQKLAGGDALPLESSKEETSSSTFQIMVVLAVAVIIIAAAAKFQNSGPGLDERPPPPPPEVVFGRILADLKNRFDQNEKLWRIVISTMKQHIKDTNPTQPNVLMLVSTPNARKNREALATEIAAAYSARCNNRSSIKVFGRDYARLQYYDAKEKVDDKMMTEFKAGACAAVVSNFEALPPASTTVFYQFCENDLAPFKNVSVIFTLEVKHGPWDIENQYEILAREDSPAPKLWDTIVDIFLHDSLHARDRSGIMKRDMVAGLLTRITPSVAWVKADVKPSA